MAIRQAAAVQGYARCISVTASDTVVIATGVTDGIVFLTTGTATVIDTEGNTAVFTAIPAGTYLPLKAIRVNATGLTAVIGALYY
jgi:hypothetical protein